ncbi:MAG: signal recognition particle protein, partial [Desulfovibrionaceae bacterium]|nr:signal recognition particle protein [Desulfovibrionaceae bacterium]
MFDTLTKRLTSALKTITGKGTLTESNIQEGLREVRKALLEADVNLSVVKTFIERVKEKALGTKVLRSLSPVQQFIDVVREELTQLLGGESSELNLKSRPSSLMMVGLQGSGKTTSLAKIALFLKKQGRRPYLVPVDIYRPAAILQLQTLAEELQLPVYPSTVDMSVLDIAKNAIQDAKEHGADVLLFDTAGRLHIDEKLMQELRDLREYIQPDEILFVADAMLGQDATTVAEQFNSTVPLTGIVFTKTDGDARGGAILSIKEVTGASVKFVGTGEKITDIEPFHPERMAERILGMGDILTLIEKTKEGIEEEELLVLEQKMRKATFTFEDFLTQMKRLQSIGSIESLLRMMPGGSAIMDKLGTKGVSQEELKKTEAIIQSMTHQERTNKVEITQSRKVRIANGSGSSLN